MKIITKVFYGRHISLAAKELISEGIWFSVSEYTTEYFNRKGIKCATIYMETKKSDELHSEETIDRICRKHTS